MSVSPRKRKGVLGFEDEEEADVLGVGDGLGEGVEGADGDVAGGGVDAGGPSEINKGSGVLTPLPLLRS
jgi:hypothetical protein